MEENRVTDIRKYEEKERLYYMEWLGYLFQAGMKILG
jgi:hypothetical protein